MGENYDALGIDYEDCTFADGGVRDLFGDFDTSSYNLEDESY